MNFSENSSIVLESIKEEKIDRIVSLDEDKLALVVADTISIYCISSDSIILLLTNKQVFDYDPCIDYMYLRNSGSLQVLVITKDNLIMQRYQECVAYFTLMEACSELFIRKKNDKPQAVARHGEDIFLYEFKNEHVEEPLSEIKEESTPSKPKKRSRNKIQESLKLEAKQINPKEIIIPIVNNLNKNFDEIGFK